MTRGHIKTGTSSSDLQDVTKELDEIVWRKQNLSRNNGEPSSMQHNDQSPIQIFAKHMDTLVK
jgi:hypothetical protein